MMILKLSNVPLRGERILKLGCNVIQTATMTGRSTRGEPLILPKPFPYQKKRLTSIRAYLDPTIVKFSQENAKIIAVEGPIGVGKSAFCKVLAEEFDMHYIPEPTMDEYLILPSGYDLRQHDDELPETVKSYDHKNFCLDPKNMKAGRFQLNMLYLRFLQYIDAMCHLLNTGQGVVLERNYYSDFVFMKAMYENKFVPKRVYDAYFEVHSNTSVILPPPHLVIYLDIPVPVVQERIRTRNYSYEQNSPALTPEYLKSLEKYWKQEYLNSAAQKSEVLVYDWTDGGDVDVIIDDIEKLDFDIMREDKKFMEWWFHRGQLLKLRLQVTNKRQYYDDAFYFPEYEVDELYIPTSDIIKQARVFKKIPECAYDMGYNPLMGDSIFSILFKMNKENHRHNREYLYISNPPLD